MKKSLLLLFPFMMFSQDATLVGDVNCDGQITSEDASLILQFVTNIIDELPCEENMTGLTPTQLQEMIDMMEGQVNVDLEQPITMIGPMYVKDEFPDFVDYDNDELYYFHGIRFCAQLEYSGYNDWVLPTPQQIENYFEINPAGFSIPNLEIDGQNYYFILKKGHNNSFQVSNALRYLTLYYLNMDGEGGVYFSSDYASSPNGCFCVR